MKEYSLGSRIVRAFYDIRRYVIHCTCTIWYKFIACIVGIQYGSDISFNGRICFNRFKYSTILIGNNCTFNSHSLFNPRGIKHCILHTATDYAKIEIGNNCGFSGVSIVCWNSVKIGNNIMVGADSCIGETDNYPEQIGTKPNK